MNVRQNSSPDGHMTELSPNRKASPSVLYVGTDKVYKSMRHLSVTAGKDFMSRVKTKRFKSLFMGNVVQ